MFYSNGQSVYKSYTHIHIYIITPTICVLCYCILVYVALHLLHSTCTVAPSQLPGVSEVETLVLFPDVDVLIVVIGAFALFNARVRMLVSLSRVSVCHPKVAIIHDVRI